MVPGRGFQVTASLNLSMLRPWSTRLLGVRPPRGGEPQPASIRSNPTRLHTREHSLESDEGPAVRRPTEVDANRDVPRRVSYADRGDVHTNECTRVARKRPGALHRRFAAFRSIERSEERRVGKECRSRWS